MKKMVSAILLLLSLITPVFAQENCDLCGTWTTVVHIGNGIAINNKIYVRINKYGDSYSVRVKEFYTYEDGSTKTYYWQDCVGVNVSENSIQWNNLSHSDSDWNDSDRINGIRIYLAKYYHICSATVSGGVLHFRYTIRGDYYGKSGNIIGNHWNKDYDGNIIWRTYDLFKDDPDW